MIRFEIAEGTEDRVPDESEWKPLEVKLDHSKADLSGLHKMIFDGTCRDDKPLRIYRLKRSIDRRLKKIKRFVNTLDVYPSGIVAVRPRAPRLTRRQVRQLRTLGNMCRIYNSLTEKELK